MLVCGCGYIANIFWAAHYGADTSLAAFLHVFAVFLLVVLPGLFGIVFYYAFRRSQRAGDWAFAICMIAQGIVLGLAPAI
jgi:hypothetical protein